MGNSNNIVRGILKVTFLLRLLVLHMCSQGVLERRTCCHKSYACLCELRINQSKNFLLPRHKRTSLVSSVSHIFCHKNLLHSSASFSVC